MSKSFSYCCPESGCRAPLTVKGEGLACPAGHFFAFAAGTEVPVFASQPEVSNEYSLVNAAEVHDNSLRWVFATFDEQEPRLRERLIARLDLKKGGRVLVTGAGAGNDLPYLVRAMDGVGEVVAQDIAKEMLLAGVERYRGSLTTSQMHLKFSVSDATNLPFADDTFDAATVGFGVRNVADLELALTELRRVLRPNGRLAILEITQPRGLLRPFFRLWFDRIVPLVGKVLPGGSAYAYLPASVKRFPDADTLAALMRDCGFGEVRYRLLAGSIVALHTGTTA